MWRRRTAVTGAGRAARADALQVRRTAHDAFTTRFRAPQAGSAELLRFQAFLERTTITNLPLENGSANMR
ncbi:hypothetical protein PC41400_06805 [Paenibacillus chitinolyticus]|uniref:Uncharacterized protein n=1 Tax=Paenibacillus chitinolyticus TaxID=79263 RepID=A0A410WT11_9BACL|nr:hypothetical protein PC41400_06805 [Paenibacillus chitinolyticus]